MRRPCLFFGPDSGRSAARTAISALEGRPRRRLGSGFGGLPEFSPSASLVAFEGLPRLRFGAVGSEGEVITSACRAATSAADGRPRFRFRG